MSDKKDNKHLTSKHYSNFGAYSTKYNITFMLKDHLTVSLRPYIIRTQDTNTQDPIDRVMSALIEIALANEDVMREVENKLKQ